MVRRAGFTSLESAEKILDGSFLLLLPLCIRKINRQAFKWLSNVIRKASFTYMLSIEKFWRAALAADHAFKYLFFLFCILYVSFVSATLKGSLGKIES